MSLADANAVFDNDTVKTQTVDATVKNDVNTLIAAFNKLTAFADSPLTDQANAAATAVRSELGADFPNIAVWSQEKTPGAWFRVLAVIIDARNVALQKGLTNTVAVLNSALSYVARSDTKAIAAKRARGARLLLAQLGQTINGELGSPQPNVLVVTAETTQVLEQSGVEDDEKSHVVVTQPLARNEPVANVMASSQIATAKKRIGTGYNNILGQISRQKEATAVIPSDAFAKLVAVTTAVFAKLNEPAPEPTDRSARVDLLQVASGELKTKIQGQLAAVANTADVSAYLPQALLQLVQLQTAARTKELFYAERFFSDLINVLLSERNVQRLRSILKTLDAKVKLTTSEIGTELKIPVGKRSPNSNIPAFGGSAERFPASPRLVRPSSPLRPESASTEITAVRRQSPQQRELPPLNSTPTILQQLQNSNQPATRVLSPPELIAAAAAARNVEPLTLAANDEPLTLAPDDEPTATVRNVEAITDYETALSYLSGRTAARKPLNEADLEKLSTELQRYYHLDAVNVATAVLERALSPAELANVIGFGNPIIVQAASLLAVHSRANLDSHSPYYGGFLRHVVQLVANSGNGNVSTTILRQLPSVMKRLEGLITTETAVEDAPPPAVAQNNQPVIRQSRALTPLVLSPVELVAAAVATRNVEPIAAPAFVEPSPPPSPPSPPFNDAGADKLRTKAKLLALIAAILME